jgi:hypothetical protein
VKRGTKILLAAVVLIVALGSVAVAADGTDVGTLASIAVGILTGFAGPWLIQPVKSLIDRLLPNPVGKKLTAWYTYAISFGLGLLVYAVTGGWATIIASPWTIFSAGSGVAGIAGLFYATFKDKYALSRDVDVSARGVKKVPAR